MIDSHSHIYGKTYDGDRQEVLQRAAETGITQLLQVGCNLAESQQVTQFAQQTPGVYASVGVHPHDASEVDQDVVRQLAELTRQPKVIAFGEIGLDYYYDNSPRDIQRKAFSLQLQKARELGLPVVIHTRDAEPDTLAILADHPIPRGGQVHCYTGTLETAEKLLEMGFHIGFTGIVTFKKSEALREVAKMVPLERILIETDSPYLAPMPHRGKRNEPAFVAHVADKIAEIKALPTQAIIAATDANFKKLYGDDFDWETLQKSA